MVLSSRYPEGTRSAKDGRVPAREIQRGGVAFGYPKDTETTEVAPPVWVNLNSSMVEHIANGQYGCRFKSYLRYQKRKDGLGVTGK